MADVIFKVRGKTAEEWEAFPFAPVTNEITLDKTSGRIKIGDGVSAWKDLPFVKPEVIDDLTTGGSYDALSAEQGKRLKLLVDKKAEQTALNTLVQTVNNNYSTLDNRITNVQNSLTTLINNKPSTTATISIGKVTTLAAGKRATVTNSGTDTNVVLDFGIPRGAMGATGSTGDRGPQGVKGDKGDKGDSVTVLNSWSTSTTAALSAAKGKELNDKLSAYSTENWTFTLTGGSTVTKKVVLSS
ncbi:MAG: collagen-like protein [Synergistaceae bacterium]|nr:collagen-like protein [Synergistaceae bacterium]